MKKGVTPLVATVLLLTISVAATGTAFTFLMQTQDDIKTKYEERFSQNRLEDQTSLNIEYVHNSTNGWTILDIRNTGSLSFPIEEDGEKYLSLYVDDRPVNNDPKSWKYTTSRSGDVVLDPSETFSLNTTYRFPKKGESVSFKINGPFSTSSFYRCRSSGGNNC